MQNDLNITIRSAYKSSNDSLESIRSAKARTKKAT
jgi:hypothetical protein